MKYDVMILGAGAAGATAAIRACRQGLKVILIDRAAESAVGASGQNVAEWVSSQVGELLAEMQIEADFLLDQPFSGLVFHSADLKRVAESPPEELSWKQSSGNLSSGKLSNKLPAFRVNYSKCVEHLRAAAAREGATILEAEPSRVELGETNVTAHFVDDDDLEPIEAAFLLLADGAQRTYVPIGNGLVTWPSGNISPDTVGRWVATLELAATVGGIKPSDPKTAKGKTAKGGKGKVAKEEKSAKEAVQEEAGKKGTVKKGIAAIVDTRMHWLLGSERSHANVLWWQDGTNCVLRSMGCGSGVEVGQQLLAMTRQLVEVGELSGCVAGMLGPAAVRLRPGPSRLALEIESHIDKRLLLIGDAGGFISEISGEGIFPAMWSACLAVESIAAAVGSRHPQDELRQFNIAWRSTMADYLRPPNTDMHFLLPLIFSNQAMADRMAAAFWEGQNI